MIVQAVLVKSPVEFSCNVSGMPSHIPSIRWMHNAVEIVADSKFYLPQPHVLRISEAVPADAGVYQCFVATPSGGEIQSSAELIIEDAPARLTSVFGEQTVHPGRSVYLHCFAVGTPAPSIVWSVDSFVVPYTAGRLIAHFPLYSSLIINECTRGRILIWIRLMRAHSTETFLHIPVA